MNKKTKSFKLLYVFVIGAAITELLITVAVLALYYGLSAIDFNFEAIYLSTTSVTILIITMASFILNVKCGKKLMKSFNYLSNATKSIVNGNYNIRLPENNRIYEVHEVEKDFNIMIEELSNTEMLREDFVANVSHEFKTPLSVIEGYVSLLQGNVSEEEKDEYINIILNNTKKLSTLTGNILALSNLENRKLPLEKEEYRLDKQICNVMVDFNEQWEQKNLEIEMNLQDISITSYRGLLSQVWGNLIQNAIKFTKPNGSLTIKCYEQENQIIVCFIDTGEGMDTDTQKHIFDKFYQCDHTRNTSGNGLGLSLVKRILELSHGKINVESTLGKGSTFTVYLPKKI